MTPQPKLSSSQAKFLRTKAHPLKVVVSIGNKGISPALVDEAQVALSAHELIKVKLPAIDKADKQAMLSQLCDSTKAACVQLIGRVGVLYRPADPAKIVLP